MIDLNAENAWGLRHMHGNVMEWTADCWHESYQGAPADGSAWSSSEGGDCTVQVVRGGGWTDPPEVLRSAFREWARGGRTRSQGFRPARTLLAP